MAINWRKKRLSNLILLATILFYIVVYVSLILVTRTGIQWSLKGGQPDNAAVSDDSGEVLYPYKNFRSISINGQWEVNVVSGSEYTVLVDMGDAKPKGAKVTNNGQTLVLTNPDKTRTLTAIVIIPDLNKISAKGSAALRLEGFSLEQLETNLEDSSRLTAENCRFANLDLRAVKNAVANFDGSPVGNAKIALSGDARAEILLDGGNLSGRVTGKSELILSGQAAVNTVRVAGDGKVTPRN